MLDSAELGPSVCQVRGPFDKKALFRRRSTDPRTELIFIFLDSVGINTGKKT